MLPAAAAVQCSCVSGRVCFEVGLECMHVACVSPRAFVFRAARRWPPSALQR